MANCELCGEPMPPNEEMFKFHGYSGSCPKPMLPRKPFGQVAYEAYCLATDGKSRVSGAELPLWENVDPRIQQAWEAAATAVRN
jgi:hypothetical protein